MSFGSEPFSNAPFAAEATPAPPMMVLQNVAALQNVSALSNIQSLTGR